MNTLGTAAGEMITADAADAQVRLVTCTDTRTGYTTFSIVASNALSTKAWFFKNTVQLGTLPSDCCA